MSTKPSVDALRVLRRLTSTENAGPHASSFNQALCNKTRTSVTAKHYVAVRNGFGTSQHKVPLLQADRYSRAQQSPRSNIQAIEHIRTVAAVASNRLHTTVDSEERAFDPISEKAKDDQAAQAKDSLQLILQNCKHSSRVAENNTVKDLCDKLVKVRGGPEGKSLFREYYALILDDCLRLGNLVHHAFAEALHFQLKKHVREPELISAQYVALSQLLGSRPPCLEALGILVWGFNRGSRLYKRHAQRRCTGYLQHYVKHQPVSTARQWMMGIKILDGLTFIGGSHGVNVITPVVKASIAAGRAERAYKFISFVHRRYHLRHSFRSLREIVLDRARVGDWASLDEILHDLHLQGYSRTMPRSFAALAETALSCIMQTRQEGHFYDYLTYCMHYHGLVPDSRISTLVYEHCIKTNRIDQALMWNKTLCRDWPIILDTCKSSEIAHRLAKQWARSESSCTSILLMIKALAFGATRNPFSQEFRLLAKDAICHSLARRLRRISNKAESSIFDLNPDKAASASDFVTQVVELMRDTFSWHVSHSGIRRQIVSAREALFLLDDFDSYLGIYGIDFHVPKSHSPETVSMSPSIHLRRANRAWLALPNVERILKKIESDYALKESSGETADSSILRQALDALQSQSRVVDMVAVLAKLATSARARQIFDNDVYITWLQMATKMQSKGPSTYLSILRALTRCTPELDLSDQLIIMVAKVDKWVDRYRRPPYSRLAINTKTEYMTALKDKLYERKWQQKDCPDAKNIEEPSLKAWKQARDLRMLGPLQSSRRLRMFNPKEGSKGDAHTGRQQNYHSVHV